MSGRRKALGVILALRLNVRCGRRAVRRSASGPCCDRKPSIARPQAQGANGWACVVQHQTRKGGRLPITTVVVAGVAIVIAGVVATVVTVAGVVATVVVTTIGSPIISTSVPMVVVSLL